ncbi:hypothetical protein LENED_010939 [Lentinula edodes]|uniref:WD40 repeat-like protein n=1 Tax=Lentinula edodes TaxID=5353 RepID=A0A1Q3ENS3_LENED|nr:hypothetical protein LENED_010939 [Lentinula edodes]
MAYHEDALLIATGDENGKICVWTSGCSPLDCSKIRFLKELLLLVGSNTIIELLRVLLTLILLVTMFKQGSKNRMRLHHYLLPAFPGGSYLTGHYLTIRILGDMRRLIQRATLCSSFQQHMKNRMNAG